MTSGISSRVVEPTITRRRGHLQIDHVSAVLVSAGAALALFAAPLAAQSSGDAPSNAPDSSTVARADSTAPAAADSSAAPASPAAPAPAPRAEAPAPSLPRLAPNAAPAAGRALGVTDTITVLKPIQVDANRTLDAQRQTVTSVKLDRSKIVRFLPQTAGDALTSVPGVDLVKTGPWASRLSVRGLSGDRVLVLVDGVRMNGVRGHGAQSSLVALDRLDAVELQPGASSAQFGSDALGGVVNFVTHRSLFGARRATVSLQSRGSLPGDGWSQSARVRFLGERLGAEFAGNLGGVRYLDTPDGRVNNSGNRERNWSARAATQLGGAVLDYEHARNGAYDIGLPAFSDDNGSHGVYPVQGRDVDRLELTRPGAGVVPDSRVLAVYQTSNTQFTETTVSPYLVRRRQVGTVTSDARDDVNTYTTSVQPTVRWSGLSNLRVSSDYRVERTAGPRATRTTVAMFDGSVVSDATTPGESMPSAWREAWSASASISPVWRGFRFETGARWDRLRSHADSSSVSTTNRLDVADERTSVEAGFAHPFRGCEPYVHASTGFRAPNLEERYYHDEIHGGMTVFGNADLHAERARNYEAGVRLKDVSFIPTARISVYRSDVEDMISIRYVDLLYGRPRFQYDNVKQARVEGVETQFNFQFGEYGVGVSGTLPRAKDRESGKRLTDAGTARATLDFVLPVRRLLPQGSLALRWRWNDAVTGEDSTLARPSFHTTNLELSSIFMNTRAAFAIRNVFNEGYREPLSFIPESGRTYAVSLRRDFDLPTRLGRKD